LPFNHLIELDSLEKEVYTDETRFGQYSYYTYLLKKYIDNKEKCDAVWRAHNKTVVKRELEKYRFSGMRLVTIKDSMDEFYRNTRNRKIPLQLAFIYVAETLNGATDEILKDMLEEIRKSHFPK